MSPRALLGSKTSVLILLSAVLIALVGCSHTGPTIKDRLDTVNEFASALSDPHVRARLIQLYLEEEISGGQHQTPMEPDRPIRPGTQTADELTVDTEEIGLLATVPGYAEVDFSILAQLADEAGLKIAEGDILQARVLLTRDDRWFLVVTRNDPQTVFVTAGSVRGVSIPMPDGLPEELRWMGGVIVADDIALESPKTVKPTDVIDDPDRFGLRRVSMNTTYLFGGARIKDAPEGLEKLGFGQATDDLGSNSHSDYLTILDPYNSESQIRVAQVTGTVLYPTEGVRRFLEEIYRFSPDDLRETLDRPAVFYEELIDDQAELVSIDSLAPTPSDPRNKLGEFHGEVVSVEGIALGTMVRTEDVPKLEDMPLHVTIKSFVIADVSGTMPVFAISSLDESGEIFGHFRVELSVYRFDDGKAFAFMVGKEPVPLDPVTAIANAGFGDPVSLELGSYTAFYFESATLSEDLTIVDADLLIPDDTSEPVVLTRLGAIITGTRVSNVWVEGHFIEQPGLFGPVLNAANQASTVSPGIVLADTAAVTFDEIPSYELPSGSTPGFFAP